MNYEAMSNEELREKIQSTQGEIEALEYTLGQLENELFYRENPECRPKEN